MPHTALPTDSDVTTALGAMNPAISLPSGFDVDSELQAAITDCNFRTRYQPFFAASAAAATAVSYDPPGPDRRTADVGGGYDLLLRNGLISLTSIYNDVDVSVPGSGTLLTLGQDFWLEPPQDPNTLLPFTSVKFADVQRGELQSIVITGVWGFQQGLIQDDAWKAIRDLAVVNCLRTLVASIAAGYTSIAELDSRAAYDPAILNRIGDFLELKAERILFRYRLLTV
jgi:hypothetical protein